MGQGTLRVWPDLKVGLYTIQECWLANRSSRVAHRLPNRETRLFRRITDAQARCSPAISSESLLLLLALLLLLGAQRREGGCSRRLLLGRGGCHASHGRPGAENEIGIGKRAHLRNIEAFDLRLGRHAVAENRVEDLEEDKEAREDEHHAGQRPDALGGKLARVTVEQPLDGSRHAVPPIAIRAV